MPVHDDDKRDVLYEVAMEMVRRGLGEEPSRRNDPTAVRWGRGMTAYYELMRGGLDAKQMGLDHLTAVANLALKQVRGQWGSDSPEAGGALFVMQALLGHVKGAHDALSHPFLQPYRRGSTGPGRTGVSGRAGKGSPSPA